VFLTVLHRLFCGGSDRAALARLELPHLINRCLIVKSCG
jgi:hypothetical protein